MLKLELIGRLGSDARLEEVNGQKVIRFNAAVNKTFINAKGEKDKRTIWVSCSKWIYTETTLTNYLTKGTQVYVRGEMHVNVYQNQEGINLAGINLRVDELELLSSNKTENQEQSQPETTDPIPAEPDDDLPY